MDWLVGSTGSLTEAAAKTALILLVATAGLRLAGRRTLAQWTLVDVVVAVWSAPWSGVRRPPSPSRSSPAPW